MSKRRSYDVSFTLRAVECAEKTSKEAAARECQADLGMMHNTLILDRTRCAQILADGHAAPMMTAHFILETLGIRQKNQVILIEAGLE